MLLKALSWQKRFFALFVGCIHFIAAAIEGMSYALIFFALSFLDSSFQVPIFLKWMLFYSSPFYSFFLWSIFLQLIRSVLVFLGQILASQLAGKMEIALKHSLMEKLLSIPYSIFSRLSRGYLLDLLQSPHRYLRRMIEELGNCLVMFFLSLGYLVLMFFLSWKLTVGVLFLIGCNGFLQKKILRKIQAVAKREEKRVKILAKRGYQRVTFGKELYLSDQKNGFLSSWKRGVSTLERVSFRLAFLRHLMQPINEMSSLLSLALVLFFVLAFSPESASFQILFTFLPLTYRLGTRLQLFLQSYSAVLQAKAPLDEVKAIFQLPSQVVSFSPLPIWSEIVLEKFEFFYPEGFGLINVNFRIKKGSFTLIMGPSGAGKSTLLDLILGLQIPNKGRILLDQQPILRHQFSSYQNLFGYVSQSPFLLEANVYQNICLQKKNISSEQIVDICKKVRLHDFFTSLSQGYLTPLGDHRVSLSGGQKQRIALARALIASNDVLVFDEPFSQLDQQTEQHILELIEELRGKKTILLVSHRFSKMEIVDKLFILDKGKLQEH